MYTKNLLLLGVAVCASLVLGGCSQDEAPVSTAQPAEPQWLVPLHPTGGEAGQAKELKKAKVTQMIEAASGGTLVADIYRLEVPPWALSYDTEYSIDPNAGTVVKVDLGPHGATFATPVTLTLDLSGTTAEGQANITLYWYDPSSNTWRDVGGVWDVSTSTLTAQLDHFSKYAPGRAGW